MIRDIGRQLDTIMAETGRKVLRTFKVAKTDLDAKRHLHSENLATKLDQITDLVDEMAEKVDNLIDLSLLKPMVSLEERQEGYRQHFQGMLNNIHRENQSEVDQPVEEEEPVFEEQPVEAEEEPVLSSEDMQRLDGWNRVFMGMANKDHSEPEVAVEDDLIVGEDEAAPPADHFDDRFDLAFSRLAMRGDFHRMYFCDDCVLEMSRPKFDRLALLKKRIRRR